MIKRICIIFVIVFSYWHTVFAEEEPIITAEVAILIDEETGTVLYQNDQHKRMFPASMTKVLTALLVLEYMDPDEIIIAGNEIHSIPSDSSRAGHRQGESILVENLVRALIIPSGNESSNIAAREVARRHTGNDQISYQSAEEVFAELMNEKARSLGAVDSNFVNPHGYHDPNHFTSAHDMALIARAAVQNDLIRSISMETFFSGNGAGDNITDDMITQEYSWPTRNQLLLNGANFYTYATGMKTGFTDEAGHCVVATAEKDGRTLIAVIFNSPDPERWVDARTLFDFGFDNFAFEIVQEMDVVFETVDLTGHRLGDEDTLDLLTNEEFGGIFSPWQMDSIQMEVVYLGRFLTVVENEDGSETKIVAPLEEGTVVANVIYTLDDDIIFEGELVASRDVVERTLTSDIEYYFNVFKEVAFSLIAIPFWIAGFTVIFLIASFVSKWKKRRARRYRRLNRRRYR